MAGPESLEIWDRNRRSILYDASEAKKIVLAYGVNGKAEGRDKKVVSLLVHYGYGSNLWCLGVTKDGYPRHPLYVPKTQELVPYDWRILYDEATLSPAVRRARHKITGA